jgi:hypothetical protein
MIFSFEASVTMETQVSCNLLVSIYQTSRRHIPEYCDVKLTLVSRSVFSEMQSITLSFIDRAEVLIICDIVTP